MATVDPNGAASMEVSAQSSMDLLLQVPMAAAFVVLVIISLLQVLLPGPISRRISAGVHWASRNTVLATIMCTLAAGMVVVVVATAAQLRFLYLSNAPPSATLSGSAAHGKGMAATAGLSATASQGQKLWTTLLLALADIVLVINIWGHAREQQKYRQAKASSATMHRQVEGLQQQARQGTGTDPVGAGGAQHHLQAAAPAGAPHQDTASKKSE